MSVAVVWGTTYLDRYAQVKQLETLKRQSTPLRKVNFQNNLIRKRLADLTGRQTILAELNTTHYPLRLIGIVSQSARNCRSRVQVRDFTLAPIKPKPIAITKQTNPGKGGDGKKKSQNNQPVSTRMRLSLTGVAVDDAALPQFIVALRDTRVFEAVALKSSLDSQLAGNPAREYLVECVY